MDSIRAPQSRTLRWAALLAGLSLLFTSCFNSEMEWEVEAAESGVLISDAASAANGETSTTLRFSGTCTVEGEELVVVAAEGSSPSPTNDGTSKAQATCSAGTWTAVLNISPLDDGVVTVSADVNAVEPSPDRPSVSLTKDTVAPVAPTIALSDGGLYTNSTSARIAISAAGDAVEFLITTSSDCETGGEWTSLTDGSEGTIELAAEGENVFYAKLRDAAGNVSECGSGSVIRDMTAPGIIINTTSGTLVNTANQSTFTIAGTCSADAYGSTISISGSATGSAICDGSTWSASELDFSQAGQGEIAIDASVTDHAGNPASGTIMIVRDTIAPEGTLSFGATITNSASQTATLTPNAIESGLEMTSFANGTCNGTSTWTSYSSSVSFTLTDTNATNVRSAKLRDSAGNESSCVTGSITFDTDPPDIELTSDSALTYTENQSYTVSGTCENGLNVTIAGTHQLGTTVLSASSPCTGGIFSYTTTAFASSTDTDSYTITATQTDSAGNSAQDTLSITIDGTPPTLTTFSWQTSEDSVTSSSNYMTLTVSGEPTQAYVTEVAGCGSGGSWSTPSWDGTHTAGLLSASISSSYGNSVTLYAKVRDEAGNESSCVSAGSKYYEQVAVRSPYGTSGDEWNEYIEWNDPTVHRAQQSPVTVCSDTSAPNNGAKLACLHAGEIRQVAITGVSSCTGLTLTEQSESAPGSYSSDNVFEWECAVTGSTATFTTRGFREGKGLTDLIDHTANEIENRRVVVSDSSGNTYYSIAREWWLNTVTDITATVAAGATLSTSKAIYLVDSSVTNATYISIAASGVSLVVADGTSISHPSSLTANCSAENATLDTSSGPDKCMVLANSVSNIWIEGSFVGYPIVTDVVIGLNGVRNSRLHRVNIALGGEVASNFPSLLVQSTYSTRFSSIRVTSSKSSGIVLRGGCGASFNCYNQFMDVTSTNNVGSGILVLNSNNVFQNIVASSNDFAGVNFGNSTSTVATGGSHNVFTRLTTSQNATNGVHISPDSTYTGSLSNNHFHNALAFSNTTYGLNISRASSHEVTQFASIANTSAQIGLGTGTNGGKFSGNLVVSGTGSSCDIPIPSNWSSFSISSPPISDTTCAANGASNDFTLTDSISLSSSYIRSAPLGAGADTNNSDGATSYITFNLIQDWFQFDHFYRYWGLYGSWPGGMGKCGASASCAITDVSLVNAVNNPLLNTSHQASTANQNSAFVGGSACVDELSGSTANSPMTVLTRGIDSVLYLKNAVEILGDYVGNENGLCEDDEHCLYTPNFGAYQGTGDAYNAGHCTFSGSDSGITGVSIFAFPNNGT